MCMCVGAERVCNKRIRCARRKDFEIYYIRKDFAPKAQKQTKKQGHVPTDLHLKKRIRLPIDLIALNFTDCMPFTSITM